MFGRRAWLTVLLAAMLANVSACVPALAQMPPTAADAKYGPHERNVLDFWRAPGEGPRPLIVFIHGGGFVAGDKRQFPPALQREALAAGISFASVNYRFVGDGTIFPAPQQDGARAIQFLRSKASEWNIDPKRIGAFGGSAGAGISLWVGYHDDLADPKSTDPVLRQSTRIQVIGSLGGQTTYDPRAIKDLIGGRAWEHPSMFKVYGITTNEQALNPTPEVRKLFEEASAVTHLTKDDPPVFLLYSEPDEALPADARPGVGIHHPRFAHMLTPKLDKLGIAWEYRHTSERKGNPQVQMLTFFKKHLGVTP
jgi:acetyl esterase